MTGEHSLEHMQLGKDSEPVQVVTSVDNRMAAISLVRQGKPALIEIGQSVPVAERRVKGGGIDPRLYNTITYKDVTTGFRVLPRVSGSIVTLEISPQRAAPSAQGGGSCDIAQMHTTVSGTLGEWIDIGGAVQEQG